MTQVTVQEAQQNLVKLIALVQQGEQVIIEESGKPVARLTAAPSAIQRTIPGRDLGRFTVPEDFDDPLPDEILKGFGL